MTLLYDKMFRRMRAGTGPLARVDWSPSNLEVFHVFLVRATRYDAAGYPIQWARYFIASNSLAVVNGVALDSAARKVLGCNVEIRVTVFDEACDVVDYEEVVRRLKSCNQRALLCLVGVQTNQFPRAVDIAQPFLAADIPVAMGGFHVSGCVSMLEELPQELTSAQQQGISLFAGEAENRRFDMVLQDAWNSELKPLYDFQTELVPLAEQPLPYTPMSLVERNLVPLSSIDLGRGCPYTCSFCCIINVQGQKSRSRSVDDLELFVRDAHAQGVTQVFLTDDNFARNKDWEAFFDRLIELRESGIYLRYIIQVDTLCHKIPRFIEKAAAAGVNQVFVGLENINPDNLQAMNKRQNKITEYREMLLRWKKHPIVIWGAYIIGLPNDTRESILRDVEIIKRELPIDILNLSIMTPLPGSEDHRRMLQEGAWMDPDLNQYDLAHRVIHHPNMTDEELDRTYEDAWSNYYTLEHMITVLKRARALGSDLKLTTAERLVAFGVITRLYKLRSYDMGLIRSKSRKRRRPGFPLEPAWLFYPKHWYESAYNLVVAMFWRQHLFGIAKRLWADPKTLEYRDTAITPPEHKELDSLDLYQVTRGSDRAVELAKHRKRAKKYQATVQDTSTGS
jgi:radical SAM superfamily enzyme YgiQ (UPF0313 family)